MIFSYYIVHNFTNIYNLFWRVRNFIYLGVLNSGIGKRKSLRKRVIYLYVKFLSSKK